ncbi:MAG: NAD(P)H-hydrate epimerase [Planctomycetota bacterium]|nr:NAD(P)H-hydrate epimerase [Planctomycetota bacterium]MEE2882387.1 NAD(P)H-hydrate epimerase [Planctomycetota bacterium]
MFKPELCSQESIRDIDRRCIDEFAIPGLILMEHASIGITLCATDLLKQEGNVIEGKKIAVCCGPGGNGGDGFAVARHLHCLGASVLLLDLAPESRHTDRSTNRSICQRLEIPFQQDCENPSDFKMESNDLIIDALLGSGISRPPEGAIAKVIDWMNGQSCPVLAVDLPSGLMADSGETPGQVVEATRTATLCLPKPGFLQPSGLKVVGEVWICSIGAPPALLHGQAPRFPATPVLLELKPGFPLRVR